MFYLSTICSFALFCHLWHLRLPGRPPPSPRASTSVSPGVRLRLPGRPPPSPRASTSVSPAQRVLRDYHAFGFASLHTINWDKFKAYLTCFLSLRYHSPSFYDFQFLVQFFQIFFPFFCGCFRNEYKSGFFSSIWAKSRRYKIHMCMFGYCSFKLYI